MHRAWIRRRSFLTATFAVAAGFLQAGCGGDDKEGKEIREADPTQKAKDSMDYYRKNVLKQKASKK